MFSFFWFIHHAAVHMRMMAVMNMEMSSAGFLGHGMQSPSTLPRSKGVGGGGEEVAKKGTVNRMPSTIDCGPCALVVSSVRVCERERVRLSEGGRGELRTQQARYKEGGSSRKYSTS